MFCRLVAIALLLSVAPAYAFPTGVQKGLKLGTGCVGATSTLARKLGTCTISGGKSRIWCPNGDIFDLDEAKASVPLARSLCNLTQIP
jgi:hypothetical protein